MPSWKRSAASLARGKRHSRKVFFVDRSIGRHIAVTALRDAGYEVIAHDERFSQDTPDEEWLPEAGRNGWIVITRDKMIRRRQNELEAMCVAKVVAFVVTAGNATGEEIAAILVKHADRMVALAKGARPPAVFSLSRSEAPMPLPLPGRAGTKGRR